MEGQGNGGLTVRGRVEIDTRQPFRSVREAVALFGEKILAGEVYGNKLKEMQSKAINNVQPSKPMTGAAVELEETKQSLQKAREDTNLMAHCLSSLRQELEHTRRELQHLKSRSNTPNPDNEPDPEIEEIKFVENPRKITQPLKATEAHDNRAVEVILEKKRSVKFANPPLLTKVMVTKDEEKVPNSSSKKVRKKPLVPLIGGLFMKKKGSKV